MVLATLVASSTTALAKLPKEMEERAFTTLERGSRSGDFETRAMAVAGLGLAPKKKALPLVMEALEDQQWQVRRAVIAALVMLKEKKALEQALVDAIRSERLDPQSEVLPLLEPLGVKAGIALLAKQLRDPGFPTPDRWVKGLATAAGDWLVEGYLAGLAVKHPDTAKLFVANLDKLPLPDAIRLYERALPKQDPAVQARVVDAVMEHPRVKDLSFLRPLVKSKDAEVAFRVAAALAKRGDPTGRALLVAAATTGEEPRKIAALQALKGVAGPDLFEITRPIVKEDTSSVPLLRAAYEIYAKVGHENLAKHLEKQIQGTDLERRAAAVGFLGAVQGKTALPTLHGLLNDGAPVMRLGAARAVGDLRQRESIDPLRQALFREPDPAVRLAIIEGLGAIRDQECIPALRFQLSDASDEIRLAAVRGLGAIRHQDAVEDLKQATLDRHPEVRRAAIQAILIQGPERYVEHFKQALGWIRAEDLDDLVVEHKLAMLPHLKAALGHHREELRQGALRALRHLPAEARETFFRELAVSAAYVSLRLLALGELVAQAGKGAADLLQTLAQDKEKSVRVAALAALGRLGAQDLKEVLFKATDDEDEKIRVAASAALLSL
jgi:HEAT repeat protein